MIAQQAGPVLEDPQGVLKHTGENNQPNVARPQLLLWTGGPLAVAALAIIVYVAYQTWYASELETGTAYPVLGALAFVYTGAVFAFSYAYERKDTARALKTTAIIVGVTLALVVILAVAFVLAAASSKKSSSSSSSKQSSSDNDDESASSPTETQRDSTPSYARRDPLTDALLCGGRGPAVRTLEAPAVTLCSSCGNLFQDAAERFCGSCGAPRIS
jgi:hypothetical protein